ncbi:Tpr-related protein family member, putative [Theileria annulata]|uniref:Tpr-related protein family member, putative n=1 Tax=Theileria annulata TaxID=5874 RepID=Q4UEI0_THEAN|nr:Tpr-related protein family member, putative [Theileria annulata]CAI74509.1 Tpr-related protein family member, putative [Theileria annulata]|eukprot:XP_952241.1 Tpr-related protein family member, putative [Theileria annulata]
MSGQNNECGKNGEKTKKIIAYMLVGFSLFNTLLIGMNGSPFSLNRFKIPGKYYSLYVSRLHNCMELACFVGVVLGNLYILPYGEQCGYISIAINWSSFIVNIVLLVSYVTGGENGHLTFFYWTLAASATIYGFNLQFIYKLGGKCMPYFMVAIPISSVSTSLIHYIVLGIFVEITISIIFTCLTASMWSVVYAGENGTESQGSGNGFQSHVISPILMTSVALSLIYVYYPGIAPGLLVDFIYVHKIDIVLMLVVPIPSMVIAVLSHYKMGPDNNWQGKTYWHGFLVFIVSMIVCSILFTISLHYPQSSVSRSIVNRPFMTGFLTILFYISHEIMLAVGFPSITENWDSTAATGNGLLSGTGVIIFVLLGEGYITEYKRHDPSKWPTDGMTTRTAFSYWMSRSFANALENVKRIFTLDVRRDILKSVRKIELI